MMNLLVIDDEPDFAGFIVDVAAGLGQKALVTHDATDLSLIDDFKPDCISLDLNMPEIDGIETIRHLAERAFPGSLILISGFNERVLQAASTLAQAHGLEVCGLLSKPAKVEDLEKLLSKAATKLKQARNVGPVANFDNIDVNAALEKGELAPFFQPKLKVRSGAIAGAEALIRWQHPERGVLAPGAFLPAVTDTDLMDRITMSMLEKALVAQKGWAEQGIDVPVAVNFEATSFNQLDLPERITEVVERVGVALDALVVEVTETSVIRNLTSSLDVLSRVCIRGIKLSIDDFGTGHSTFDQLRTIPFSQIKIDRSFVQEMEKNTDAQAIVRSMIELAARLKMGCVAEGIETRRQYDMLRAFGCHEGQGYFFARPMPSQLLNRWFGEFGDAAVA